MITASLSSLASESRVDKLETNLTMFVKLAVLCALAAVAMASYGLGGHSNSFRKQDDHGNYEFGYDIVGHDGGKNSRHEAGDGHGHKHGSYSLHDIDGRHRLVKYTADKSGFRAHIHSNEPGVVPHYAADAPYNGGHGVGAFASGAGGAYAGGGYEGGFGGGY